MTEVGMMEDRFWEKVDKSGDCWIWTAARDRHGYGKFAVDRRPRAAHRVAYEIAVGPIPEGLELDHLCRVPACVNPAHLEPVTHAENVRRGAGPSALAAMKTACDSGHSFDAVNTYVRPDGRRSCRQCAFISRTRWRTSKT